MTVQSDGTILLEVDNDSYVECRDWLSRFAELVKSPEYVHTYRLTPLAIWNAAASGLGEKEVLSVLQKLSRYEVPQNILADVRDWFSRYGSLRLEKRAAGSEGAAASGYDPVDGSTSSLVTSQFYPSLIMKSEDELLIEEIMSNRNVSQFVKERLGGGALLVEPAHRGRIKQALIKIGYPVEDLVGYLPGEPLEIRLRERLLSTGEPFSLREYQQDATDAFYASGSERGGSGVVVLPCGAGKTVVGIEAMSRIAQETLIIGSSTVGVRQWITELLDKTTLARETIGEYTGDVKEVKPVTVTTYQCMTYNHSKKRRGTEDGYRDGEEQSGGGYPHLEVFRAKNWGLVIYDEVHLLPAPVFRMTAEIQAKRRLGLTATLVREDGMEEDVFSLVGPKRYDSPWKELESQGWIAQASCFEIRVPIEDREYRLKYATAPLRLKYRIAAENPKKFEIVKRIVSEHGYSAEGERQESSDSILVIGDYIDQLLQISRLTRSPIVTGKTPNPERERLYSLFKKGQIKLLVVSKVANYAIDLPDANVALQVSGTFGSRQEEAQRLGRLLRPKKDSGRAYFYTIVSKDTVDQDYASKRQLFLTEKGYNYSILDGDTPQLDTGRSGGGLSC